MGLTTAKTTSNAKSTNDSISARPRIIMVWMRPAAPGLRAAPSQAAAAKLWSQANTQTMKDAATVPLNAQKWPVYHSSRVQGCNFFFFTLSCDPTNVWVQ